MNNFRITILLPGLFSIFNLPHFASVPLQNQAEANRKIRISESLSVYISAVRNHIIRVDFSQSLVDSAGDIRFSVNIHQDSTVKPTFQTYPDSVILSTPLVRMKLHRNPLEFTFSDAAGRALLQSNKMETVNSGTKAVSFQIQPGDRFFGLGQKSIPLDRRGYRFRMFNTHIGGYSEPYANMQINVPYVYSPVGYGVFFDVQYPGTFDFGKTDSTCWSFEVENGPLTIYFVYAESPGELQKACFDLTGYPPMLPKWTLGLLQSRCVYRNEQHVDSVLTLYAEKHLPLDAIILDVYWFGTFNPEGPRYMGNLSWLADHFPDPEAYMKKLKQNGIKTILISEPIINLDSYNYPLLKENNWLIKQKNQSEPYVLSPYWAGDASLLDITHPGAQQWLWSKYRDLIKDGVDGLWTDLGEPEADVPDGITYAGPLESVHNLYNLFWAKTIFDGFRRDFPDRRLFNLTRSGYAGIQRFSTASWSGDASKTWNALRLQVPMMLGAVMSGIPCFSSDIGGFTNAWDVEDASAFSNFDEGRIFTTGELYTRWFQMGVFSPMLRPHSGENQACEPFAFDDTTEAVTADFLRLRYQLIPYIYSYMHKTSEHGETLIKPLGFVFDDQQIWNQDDTYLFGNEMLIAPVLQEKTYRRSVFLPRLDSTFFWIDFWTDSLYKSGTRLSANAPLNRIPVFIRQPAIIPMGKVKKYVNETPDDTLTIHVYPGGMTRFDLYEDDGNSNDYLYEKYAITQINTSYTDGAVNLSIKPAQGHYPDLVKLRTWIIVFHLIQKYNTIHCNGQKLNSASFKHSQINASIQLIHTSSTRKPVNAYISGVHLTTD